MRIAVFDDYRVGILDNGSVRDVSAVIGERWRGTPYAMNDLIARWDDDLAADVERCAQAAEPLQRADVRLLPPIPRPRQLLAAPLNYDMHVDEMVGSRHAPNGLEAHHSARELGFFVKAAGSISGPEDPIQLPALGRSFHHEVELGVVIGKTARGLDPGQAESHIFGYVCLLDITMRTDGGQQEERAMRKSFDSFTPLGPCLVTADEVADSGQLDLRLWVNGELRQSANTSRLIVGVDELIVAASDVVTLHPGDIYATGTPDGVGPIVPGDTVRASVQSVGELELPVVERDW
jgi:2-keto-4-pentenoate hydratase/2-oxohepta-3-ene-1,7-dioic acid hydratase in catechol pathway